MSETQMRSVWAWRLRRRAKFVALALAWSATEDGWCSVSLADLAALTGYSQRVVQLAIDELIAAGYLDAIEPPTRRVTPTLRLRQDEVAGGRGER